MIDQARMYVRGGAGGNGIISFRREKFVPRGGPDGGDGGQGGSVVLLADPAVSTLQDVRYKRRYIAKDGGNGAGSRMHGRSARDLVVRLPVGTQVRRLRPGAEPEGATPEDWELVADLDAPGATFVAAHGGMGGKGNARFVSSTNQAPRIVESGQRGEDATLLLDLKLISEAGIIGVPSAGKSTLIAAVSAARPKIADYPFTTLEPVLGVVEVDFEAYVMADIPGLIEGAHAGVGLGHDFLRHVERTRLLVHLLDGSRDDPIGDFDTINRELALFSAGLAAKPQIVVINKIDREETQERLPELQAELAARGITPLLISAATGEGTRDLARRVWAELQRMAQESPLPAVVEPEAIVLRPEARPRVTVERVDGVYHVHGRRPAAWAEMLDLQSAEPRAEFFRRLNRYGIAAALRRAGVQPGDRVRFGSTETVWEE